MKITLRHGRWFRRIYNFYFDFTHCFWILWILLNTFEYFWILSIHSPPQIVGEACGERVWSSGAHFWSYPPADHRCGEFVVMIMRLMMRIVVVAIQKLFWSYSQADHRFGEFQLMMMRVIKKTMILMIIQSNLIILQKKIDDSVVMGMKMTMIRMIKMITSIDQSTVIKL